jgi:hypothetical protein
MRRARLIFCGSLLVGLGACHSQPADPAPPPARFELAVAPPGARGARAAGTDAAPPPPSELGTSDPDEPGESDEPADGGTEPDAAVTVPDSDGGVAL